MSSGRALGPEVCVRGTLRWTQKVNADDRSHTGTWHAERIQCLINSAWPRRLPSTPVISKCPYSIKTSSSQSPSISCLTVPAHEEEWRPMGHVMGHGGFLRGGGSLPVEVVDYSGQFCFTGCHIISSVHHAVRVTVLFCDDSSYAPPLH